MVQVEAAKREVTRAGARPADREIWETQLVALQVRTSGERAAGFGSAGGKQYNCMILQVQLFNTFSCSTVACAKVAGPACKCEAAADVPMCRTRGACTATRSTCWRWSCWGGSTGGGRMGGGSSVKQAGRAGWLAPLCCPYAAGLLLWVPAYRSEVAHAQAAASLLSLVKSQCVMLLPATLLASQRAHRR